MQKEISKESYKNMKILKQEFDYGSQFSINETMNLFELKSTYV